jgi:hypothetical protein
MLAAASRFTPRPALSSVSIEGGVVLHDLPHPVIDVIVNRIDHFLDQITGHADLAHEFLDRLLTVEPLSLTASQISASRVSWH